MAKYSKRSDGLYVANRTINGKRKVFYGRTCKEVDEKIEAYIRQKKTGPTLKAVAERWWADVERGKPSTASTYKPHYKGIVDDLGHIHTTELTVQMCRKHVAEFAARGYSYGYVNLRRSVLSAICGEAVDAGDMDYNPVHDVKMPKTLEPVKRPALTEEQQAKVEAFNDGSDLALFGQLLLWSGLRIGELAALTWQDIDTKAGVIHVTKKINYVPNWRGTLEEFLKSKRGKRDVPIFGALNDILPRNRIGLIFHREDGEHCTRNDLDKMWSAYCKAAGIRGVDGETDITPHQLRHTFATICYEGNVDVKTCAKWMGDSEAVVAEIYQDLRPKKETESREQMDEYLAKRSSRA